MAKINRTYTGGTKKEKAENDELFRRTGKPSKKICYLCKRLEGSESWVHEFNEETQIDDYVFPPIELRPLRVMPNANLMIEYNICTECIQLIDIAKRMDMSVGQGVYVLRNQIAIHENGE